jgi:uncharacterized protein YqeY
MKDRIRKDLTEAMKAKDAARVSALRMILSEMTVKEKEKGVTLTDEVVTKVLFSMIKKRKEAIDQFGKGGREDLAKREEAEIKVIEHYLPPQLSPDEIRKEARQAIEDLGVSDVKGLGKVMSILSKKLSGKAEGAVISRIVKEELKKDSSDREP